MATRIPDLLLPPAGAFESQKFSYLKDFVVLKVMKSIDGLPFTSKGYAKAKSILKELNGNDSEVEKAYV